MTESSSTLREVSNLAALPGAKQRMAQRLHGVPLAGPSSGSFSVTSQSQSLRMSSGVSQPSFSQPPSLAMEKENQLPQGAAGRPHAMHSDPMAKRPRNASGLFFGRSSHYQVEGSTSPRHDQRHAGDPTYCTGLIKDISRMYIEEEIASVRRFHDGHPTASVHHSCHASPNYLKYQPEINEKMRMILVDWLVDVHQKFKLHAETMFLAVNLVDRFLSCYSTKYDSAHFIPRSQLQLIGITGMLLAAKYEEIWPPEVKECVHISAGTYTRDEVLRAERQICASLSFRLTVPTPFPFAKRLLSVLEGTDFLHLGFPVAVREAKCAELSTTLSHCTFFFLEHALLDYTCLRFTPSQVANAAVYLALLTMQRTHGGVSGAQLWDSTLQHYSRAKVKDFKGCAEVILQYVSYVPTIKYQAVRRKYGSSKHGEVSKMLMPNEVVDQ